MISPLLVSPKLPVWAEKINTEINSFELLEERLKDSAELHYAFDVDALGDPHQLEDDGQYITEIIPTPETDETHCLVRLRSPTGSTVKTRQIREVEHNSVTPVSDRIESQIWDFAVYLREQQHHPARDRLEELGIHDYYPPEDRLGRADRANQWHFKTDTDHRKQDYHPEDSGFAKSAYVDTTRMEWIKTNETGAWYCGTLTVSFDHTAPKGEQSPETVYNPHIYILHYPIKPFDKRESINDTKEIVRKQVLNPNEDQVSMPVNELITHLKRGMKMLVDIAEAQDDHKRQEKIKEAKVRGDPATENDLEDQTNATQWL